MAEKSYRDEIVILRVKDWQTADKHAVCFSRAHGKVSFLAYGARYARSTGGRLIQPFVVLDAQLFPGRRLDTLRDCELVVYPKTMNMEQMAYAALIAEVTENLTEEHQPQEEIYELLLLSFDTLMERNPRLTALSTICKLLFLTGVLPQYQACVNCGQPASDEDAFFSVVQGGLICKTCHCGEEMPFSMAARELLTNLLTLDFRKPHAFKVYGGVLMEVERLLLRFVVYQTDKQLNCLSFLSQL